MRREPTDAGVLGSVDVLGGRLLSGRQRMKKKQRGAVAATELGTDRGPEADEEMIPRRSGWAAESPFRLQPACRAFRAPAFQLAAVF